MSAIDERIVSMKFNNGQFLTGIAATLNALANLKKGLNLDGAKKGVDGLNSSMAKMPPPQMAAGIQGLSGRFTALATLGVTALATIAHSAIAAGGQILSSLTIDPVKQGLAEYETTLNSVQTILANTGLEGDKGLAKVSAKLQELNDYSDQTIYNFAEMAKNIGTFTAAGVDLDTSTNAIKGIANLAAISGSNSQQASTAMYQLSQSLSAGKVSLEDWNSVVNAGLGGKVFQEAIKETARVHGVAVDDIIKEQGSFRNSLQEGWITSEILTETLSKFTGDLTKSQLKAMGYNDEQITGIQKMAETAQDAATKVKTMSQLISTLQETAQSGWAKTWQLAFGNFNEARVLFTDVNNVLGALIGASADARNKMIGDWNKLGGRTVAIEAIGNAFNFVLAVIKPIRQAFRDIFPATTGKDLFTITKALRDFTETLKIGGTEASNLRRTFAGVFAIFSIIGQIVSGVIGVIGRLFGVVGEGGDSFLNLTGNIGDFLVSVDEAMKKGEGLNRFFEGLGNVLEVPLRLLGALGDLISGAFQSFDEGSANGIENALERIGARLEPFRAMADLVANAWGHMGDVLKNVFGFMAPFAEAIGNIFGSIGEAIASSVSDGDFSTVLDTINTGLLGVLVVGIRKFLADGKLFSFGDSSGGFLDGIKTAFGGLNDTLSALQANLKAGTLIKIAAAVAILTASVVALSLIDSGKLTKALTALTVMFAQLAGAMALFEAVTSTGGVLKLAPMAAGLILLSAAILILSTAVKVLSTMSWEELLKGLGALVVILAALAGTAQLMKGAGTGMVSAGVGISAMAVGIKILASAVKDLSGLSWEEMIRGLTGLVVVLGAVAGAMKLMTGAIPGALAMLIVAPALILLAVALKMMAEMSWEDFGKSMAVLAGGLLIIAGALYLMSAALPGAAAMLVVAPALIIMAAALKIMATMSWEDFGKSMAILGGALTILAITLTAMIVALPGAAALLVAAAALAVLAPILLLFGAMSWEEIGKGLTMLAATLTILGIAGIALLPALPGLIGLGVAIALIGIGALAAGVGVLAFATGLTALSVASAVGATAIVAIVSAIIGLIPMAMNALAEGIVLFANVIGNSAPTFVVAMTKLMMALLNSVNTVTPKVIDTIWNLVLKLANRVADGYPKLVDAGLRLITGILNGIANNIGGIVTAATNIIVAFINALAKNLPRITEAGANLIITLVESLAGSINRNAGRMQAAGRDLAFAIVNGMTGGLLSGASNVIGAAADMAGKALNAAKKVLGIASPSKEFAKIGKFATQGFAKGLTGDRSQIRAAVKTMHESLSAAIRNTNEDVSEAEARLKKLTSARVKDVSAIKKTEAALNKARKENAQARSAKNYLSVRLDDEQKALERLSKSYDSVTNRLKDAHSALADARQERTDYWRSIRGQFGDLGQIEGNTLKGFTTSLKAQLKETQEFKTLLATLRKNGLSDALYEELLSKGTDALPLLRSINQGGKAGISELNKLSGQLGSSANSLGKVASQELYQAGVDAAVGLVKGLQRQQKNIAKQMDKIADSMVKAIKKKLGIKSPSKEFAKIGVWTGEGLVTGLDKTAISVRKASEGLGNEAVTGLKKTMQNIAKSVDGDWDMQPVIRPVLDLTNVRKYSKTIPSLIKTPIITPIDTTPTSRIGLPSNRFAPGVMPDVYYRPSEPPVNNYNFTQNNTSPTALSEVDIYRNTNNLVSRIKGGLPS